MADMNAARQAAQAAKDTAKAKIAAAKREAAEKKALRLNPPPKYVTMPEPTGDAEADSAADLTAVQAGFRARAQDESGRKALVTDSEFWACLCFQTRAQKDAFLRALKLLELGDKYIDGEAAAKVLGIELPAERPPYHDTSKVDRVWSDLAM